MAVAAGAQETHTMADIKVDQTTPDQAIEQPPKRSRLPMLLLFLGLMTILVAQMITVNPVQTEKLTLQAQASAVVLTLTVEPTSPAEELALRKQLLDVRKQADALDSVQATLNAGYVNWPAVIATLVGHDPARMKLTAVAQNGTRVELRGDAIDEGMVVQYADALRRSGLFTRVNVQSITLRDFPTFTPLPTSVTTPGAPTRTPAPSPQPETRKFARFEIVVDVKGATP